jgi:hypothetical protein
LDVFDRVRPFASGCAEALEHAVQTNSPQIEHFVRTFGDPRRGGPGARQPGSPIEHGF